MGLRYYVLKDKVAVGTNDVNEWVGMFERDERSVALTELPDGIRVSTVFLGLDYSFGDGPPLLFETMIFGGKHSDYVDRYSTWQQAEAGHAVAVALADGDRWAWWYRLWMNVKRAWSH